MMDKNIEDRIRLLDMADSIREIQGYVGDGTLQEISMSEDAQQAISSQLAQIGGAAAMLSEEFKEKYSDIDWDVLKGLQYVGFDHELELDMRPQFHIVSHDLPVFLEQISDLATELERNESMEDDIFDSDAISDLGEFEKEDYESESYLNTRLGDTIEEELNASDKMLIQAIKEDSAEVDGQPIMVSDAILENMDIADDSFIDQRFEDVDLLATSSLDDPNEE